jgi:hypothetical protein
VRRCSVDLLDAAFLLWILKVLTCCELFCEVQSCGGFGIWLFGWGVDGLDAFTVRVRGDVIRVFFTGAVLLI